ncbi:MAG: NfeD family protein [Mediterraneibacter sp.]
MGADFLNISPAMLNLIWLGLFILLLVIEIITVGLTTIWFAAGALAALAANVLGADLIIQIIIFLAVSIVLLIFTRPWAEKHLNRKRVRTNYEREIGKVIRITEKVDNLNQTGKSVVDGQEWTVRSKNDSEIFEAGALARVAAVSGVKLIVEKCEEETV